MDGFEARVLWWHEPFNYSAVNNHAVDAARGELLVFLNDDCRVRSADWLHELAGWATQGGIGTVGVQLIGAEGTIQHGGVVLGLSGFADHLFAGLPPDSETWLGSTNWYRNTMANTAACVAVRRGVFEEVGGFDERFELLGSDVALGLACHGRGYRNVTTPMIDVDHLESVTRGPAVPSHDMFASYWWYQRWLRVGIPSTRRT
ncbi:MAG: glycosyltransferase [Microthrixaceae bacterium]|nr:glycosyltransferase [Microthrixaceae bacterium]